MKLNKIFKVAICMLLGLVMALSVTACSKNGDESEVESIDIPATLVLNVGEESALQVTLLPFGTEAPVSWKSSDTSVATVSEEGTVKAVAVGAAIVRATAGGKSADCTVTVQDPSQKTVAVSGVTLSVGVLNLEIDGTATLTATVKPDNATDKSVTWSSSNNAVATVSATGEVKAVAAGTALITATSNSNSSQKATCIVKVGGGSSDDASAAELFVKKVNKLEGRNDFIMGMDVSEVLSIEAARKANDEPLYKNFDGEEEDVFKILKDNGITDVRIRIWNDPYVEGHSGEQAYSYGGGNCDVDNAVEISKRCKAVGLGVIIDFHYSDFWADPGKQKLPKAWEGLSTAEVAQEIYDFTKESLEAIKETQVKITMVQIGNETTGSMAGSSNWTVICNYMNQGSKAVRDVTGAVANGGAKVAVHFTNAGSGDYTSKAQTLKNNNVDYDVFGTSWYPYYNSHGTLKALATQLENVNKTFKKEVMVLETAYAFTYEDADGLGNTPFENTTHPITVQGMSNSVREVIETIANLGDYGLGVCYWGGIWIAASTSTEASVNRPICAEYGCGWATAKAKDYDEGANDGGTMVDNNAFFLSDGTPLEALKVFYLAKEGQEVDPVADYLYAPELFYTVNEGEIEIPKQITIVLNDGSVIDTDALWEVQSSEIAEYIHTVGDYVIKGTTVYGGDAVCYIYVQNKNLLTDGSFEDAKGYGSTDSFIELPSPWQGNYTKTSKLQLYVSNDSQNAKMGKQSFHFWDEVALNFDLYQTLTASEIAAYGYGYGTYTLSADFAGGDCGDSQDIYVYVKITYSDGTPAKTVKGSNAYATGWKQWSRSFVDVEIGANVASIEAGFHVTAEAGGWGNIDNVQFFFKSSSAG